MKGKFGILLITLLILIQPVNACSYEMPTGTYISEISLTEIEGELDVLFTDETGDTTKLQLNTNVGVFTRRTDTVVENYPSEYPNYEESMFSLDFVINQQTGGYLVEFDLLYDNLPIFNGSYETELSGEPKYLISEKLELFYIFDSNLHIYNISSQSHLKTVEYTTPGISYYGDTNQIPANEELQIFELENSAGCIKRSMVYYNSSGIFELIRVQLNQEDVFDNRTNQLISTSTHFHSSRTNSNNNSYTISIFDLETHNLTEYQYSQSEILFLHATPAFIGIYSLPISIIGFSGIVLIYRRKYQ